MLEKRGQVAIFIIVAILIVGGVILLVAFRDKIFSASIPGELQPVYRSYQECITEEVERGLALLASQGGRIDTPLPVIGNDYSPFGESLDFYGTSIPYWYRLNENGFIEENVPTKGDMERELAVFVSDNINECDLSDFYEQGFYIDLADEVDAEATISDGKVDVRVDAPLSVSREDISARQNIFEISVQSRINELYDAAKEIYRHEAENNFVEEYGVDALRLYAPVDGVDIQCAPRIWKTAEVIEGLKDSLESNLGAVKFEGGDFDLKSEDNKYFVVDAGTNFPARLIYSKAWPSVFEVSGDRVNKDVMIADPIGNQQGLGVMGFCYVPYHFVYNLRFPVVVQVGDGLDSFQFPITALIENNVPKKAELLAIDYSESEFRLCDFKEGDASIYTYDENLNPIEADIRYECLDQICDLGRTEISGQDAVLNTKIPLCVNGKVIASSEGFSDGEKLFSSNSESFADIILEREYDVKVDVFLGGDSLKQGEQAVVHFENEQGSASAVIPGNDVVSLKEGNYKISVYVYGNSSVTIPASSKRQCSQVAKGGIAGFFGSTKEQCFNIEVPSSKIDYALRGGGSGESYILASELSSGKVRLEVEELPLPNSLEQLQYNYESFNDLEVGISFI